MDGFLLVDKPKGMTSQKVVNIIKQRLKLKKCGHSGTLDPDTTGLLVVACNQATKLMKWVNASDKEYLATIVFGFDSDTLDVSGNISKDISMQFSLKELDEAIQNLKKQTTQIPPLVSAIKVDGKKLYEYAWQNKEVSVNPRNVEIINIKRLSGLKRFDNHLEVTLFLHVSKGFYVRSFARDLGQALGGCAILKGLRRLKSGEYKVEDSIPLENISNKDIIPIEKLFPLKTITVNDYIAKLVLNGITLDNRQTDVNVPFFVVNKEKKIAIYEPIENNEYKPLIIWKEEKNNENN